MAITTRQSDQIDAGSYEFVVMSLPTKSDFSHDITWPLQAGGGGAFRPNDKLLLALEALWTQWSEEIDVLEAEYDDANWQAAMEASEGNLMKLHWDDAVQIHLGCEYKVSEKVALRGGGYHYPAPCPDETMNILLPNTDFISITTGVGYNLEQLDFDFTVEYLIGSEREVEASPDNMPGTHGMNILAPSIAVTYTF